MHCGIEQQLLDMLKAEGVIVESEQGIIPAPGTTIQAYYSAFTKVRKALIRAIPELGGVVFNVNAILPWAKGPMKLNSGAIEAIEKLIEAKRAAANNAKENQSYQQFTGATAQNTVIDALLRNPTMDRFIKTRKKMQRALLNKKSNITFELSNPRLTKEERRDMYILLEQVEADLDLVEKQLEEIRKAPLISTIIKMAVDDFKRIRDFIEGQKYQDLSNINSLLSYYIDIASYENNPLIPKGEMYLPNGDIKEEYKVAIERDLVPVKRMAEQLKAELEYRQKEMAFAIVSNNLAYQEMFKDNPKSFEELMHLSEGLPDATWVDAYLMDITNGIFGSNGILPQIMQMRLDEAIAKYTVNTRRLHAELDRTVPKAQEALKKLGLTWSIFFGKTEGGLREDATISPIRSAFYAEVGAATRKFRKNVKKLYLNSAGYSRYVEALKKELEAVCDVVDITLIPEISGESTPESEAYKKKIIDRIGQYAYEELVDTQKKKLTNFEDRKEAMRHNLMSQEKVENYEELSASSKTYFEAWEKHHSPYNAGSGGNYTFNTFIPKEGSNHINRDFDKIQNNKDLLEFYKVLKKYQDISYNMLPPDKQKALGKNSILRLEKTFWDVWADPNLTLLEKLSAAWKSFLDNLRQMTSKRMRDKVCSIQVDPDTGEKRYRINDGWFSTNRDEATRLYLEKEVLLMQALGYSPLAKLHKMESTVDISNNTEAKNIFAELLGVAPINSELERVLGQPLNKLNAPQALKMATTDAVMAENSIDLPKMLMLQMHLTSMYAARTEALPEIELLKKYYEDIRTPEGKKRDNAVQQMDSWFNRVVLDNYENNNELDAIDDQIKDKKLWRTDEDKKKIADVDRVLKILEGEMQTAIETENVDMQDYIQKKIDVLNKKKETTGFFYSISAIAESFLRLIRFKALGYNISSNITNYAEGQISNFLHGEQNTYFNSEQLKRANNITLGNTMSTITRGKVSNRKVSFFMKKFDVQQDASNEFQKATRDSSYDTFSKLGPFEFTKRTEFLNQSPVLVAMMLNTEIKDKDGKVSNVWDAMDENGKLLPGFDTEENKATWEDNSSREYFRWKSKVNKAIIDIHGDYHDTHGNMASEYFLGKTMLMFKRWMIRMIANRYAKEQIDLESGKKIKGRHRSASRAQIALGFSAAGLIMGPITGAIGVSLGLGLGFLYGSKYNVSFVQDLIEQSKMLAWNMLRFPVNRLSFWSESEIVKNKEYGYTGVEEIDVNNMKANIAEMSMYIYMTIVLAMLKAMLMGDDDDDDDKELITALINRNMQLLQQSQLYINPLNLGKNLVTEMGLYKHLDETGKAFSALNKYIHGEDVALWNKMSKAMFLPSPLRSEYLGLGAQSKRVFDEWGYDTYFKSGEDKAKGNLTRLRQELKEDLSDKYEGEELEANIKAVTNRLRKKKGESYEEAYERAQEIIDSLEL